MIEFVVTSVLTGYFLLLLSSYILRTILANTLEKHVLTSAKQRVSSQNIQFPKMWLPALRRLTLLQAKVETN